MFWFVVFGSFLGADVAQMKSTLMLGPFSAETECWETGAATLDCDGARCGRTPTLMRSRLRRPAFDAVVLNDQK
jgi:hypothetical protein